MHTSHRVATARLWRSALVLACLCGTHAAASAQGPTTGQVRAWIEAESSRSQSLSSALSDVAFRWAHGSPQAYDGAEARNIFWNHYELRFRDVGNWRLNREYHDARRDAVLYFDKTLTDAVAWQITPSQLTVHDPSRGVPEGLEPESNVSDFTYAASLLIFGGLDSIATFGLTFDEVQLSGSDWTCMARHDERGIAIRYRGAWSSEHDRGFVLESQLVEGPEGRVGRGYRFVDWTQPPETEWWVASRVEEFDSQGRVENLWMFEGATAEPADFFETVIQVPKPGGVDPIRGEIAIASIVDYRPADATAQKIDSNGNVIAQTTIAQPGRARDRFIRIAGWIAAAGLAVVLIAVRRGHFTASS